MSLNSLAVFETSTIHNPPIRITDLIRLKEKGATITCSPTFEVIPVDFAHRACRFKALVFFCRFSGTVDGQRYTFRKCYARGCKHDRCPRVSQAVMIANRYLQRDYRRLEEVGVNVERKLFTLEDSVVKIMGIKSRPDPARIIEDYIDMAKGGGEVRVNVDLEYVPSTEHFEHGTNQQTFLMVNFAVEAPGESSNCQRCLGCYPTEREREERPRQIQVANDRLSLLYEAFPSSSIAHGKKFFR